MPAAPPARGGPGPTRRPSGWARWRARRVEVRDESMAPTLRPGDRLRVDTRSYRDASPRVGDIVVLVDPELPGRWLIKRIAAVGPGTYAGPGDTTPTPVPDRTVFVVGDARGTSRDSRHFGPLPFERVLGRAVERYAPVARRGPL